MKILVPTDFSNPSKNALVYAMQMAKKLQGEICILWFNSIQSSKKTLSKWKRLEADMHAIAEEDAMHLLEDVRKEVRGSVPIEYHFTSGSSFAESVNKYALKNSFDLIIMGTKGATGLKKVIIGSHTASMIDASGIPVLVVPEKVRYKPLKNIVYASTLYDLDEEIKTIVSLATLYRAMLHVVHIVPSVPSNKNTKNFYPELIKTAKYPKIRFQEIRNSTISKALDNYIQKNKIDLICLFTHKLDMYEKLFGKSVTRQLAFHAHCPLLTFNKTLLV
jgi:nucleotide-binding universal stress UspA family protein